MKRFISCFIMAMLLAVASQLRSDENDDLCGSNFTTFAGQPAPPALHVGVILVQFSDAATNVNARGSHCKEHLQDNHYTYQEFNRHLFSQDIYTTTPNSIRTHDLEEVFGSMRDFFDENSYGKFAATGRILNDTTSAGVPIWVTLNETKQTWDAAGLNPNGLLNAAIAVSSFNISGFDRMIVIYAGEEERGGLNPATNGSRFVYQIGEKRRTSSNRGRTGPSGALAFYGIGTHCHEFGHLLGLPDIKEGNQTFRRGLNEWALMSVGNQGFMDGDPLNNTTIGGYHAPTHLSGWSKLSLGWANYEEFTEGNITFPHFEEDDQICVYFINDNNAADWDEGEYFIFENRRPVFSNGARTFDGDMTRNGVTGGLIIFHHRDSGSFANGLEWQVIEADNNASIGRNVGGSNMADIFPGITNNTEFSPTSTPNSNAVNGSPSGLALLNITNNNGVISAIADFGPPAAPQNLVISNPGSDGSHPILQWDANTEPDIDHYLVWRGSTPNWKTTSVTWEQNPAANVTGTTWTDNQITIDLDVLTSAYYRLTAVDDADNESDYSSQVRTTSSPIFKPELERQEFSERQELAAAVPVEFAIHQNYPNPFNPETQIRFELPEAARVTVTIFNVLGEAVRTLSDGVRNAGNHSLRWNGKDAGGNDVPSGLYIYRIEVAALGGNGQEITQIRKMTLLR